MWSCIMNRHKSMTTFRRCLSWSCVACFLGESSIIESIEKLSKCQLESRAILHIYIYLIKNSPWISSISPLHPRMLAHIIPTIQWNQQIACGMASLSAHSLFLVCRRDEILCGNIVLACFIKKKCEGDVYHSRHNIQRCAGKPCFKKKEYNHPYKLQLQ